MKESVDRRILGAFQCVDAITGSALIDAIPVTMQQSTVISQPWVVKANRSGVYVIFDGPNFSKVTQEFSPTDWPTGDEIVKFEITLTDPSGRYLPRRAKVRAPQDLPAIPPALSGSSTNPAALAALRDVNTVFDPQPVKLYPAPSAPIGPNWAVIHASVVQAGTTPPKSLPWAALQITRDSDNQVLASGQAYKNGEALLAVRGLTAQPSSSGTGPVTVSTVAVTVKAFFDPSVLDEADDWVPNPDDILNNTSNPALKNDSQSVQLTSGQELVMNFNISV